MFKREKKLRELSRKLEKFEPYETDEEGRRVVRLHIHDDSYFLSPLSVEGVPVISDETAYLLNFYLKNMTIDGDERLHFAIRGHDLTQSDMNLYRRAVLNYYKEEFIDVEEQFRENRRETLVMLLFGFGIMGIKLFVSLFIKQALAIEAIDIAGWVFIWRAVEVFFISRPHLRRKQIQNLKVLEADITFEDI